MAKKPTRKQEKHVRLDKRFNLSSIDADSPLVVIINRDDLNQGVPGDGEHCAIARACHRQFGASQVLIGKSVAHVEMPDGEGGRHMVRFGIDKESKEIIVANDEGHGSQTDEIVVKLVPKPPSQRLDAERKAMRGHREKTQDPQYQPQARRKRGQGSYQQRTIRDLRGQI